MADLLALSSDCPELTVVDDVVLAEGTRPGRLLVLVSGEVVVEHDGVPFARVDAPGAVFGEMSAVLDRPATATVRARRRGPRARRRRPARVPDREPRAPRSRCCARPPRDSTASRSYLVDVKQQFADAGGHLGMVDQILDQLVHHQAPTAGRTGSARDPEGDHDDEH